MTRFDWLGAVVGFLSGASVAVFADPIRRSLFRPHIRLIYRSGDPAYDARTPERISTGEGRTYEYQALFIRVKVHNSWGSMAVGCGGYLVNVERWDPRGKRFEPAPFYDPVRLAWSSRREEAYDAIDLAKGLWHFLDVASSREVSPEFRLETQVKPLREAGIVREPGAFRLTINVGGDNFKMQSFRLVLKWTGEWDKLSAEPG